jgi:uncharacterized cofD-like protein
VSAIPEDAGTAGRSRARRLAALPARPLRVVAAGGGSGLPRVLAGLAGGVDHASGERVELTAVVTTADDGGSSGELRRRYGVPAPGDVRNCLVALAGGLSPLAGLFQHRFGGEGGLAGHTVGNVVLTALAQRLGDFGAAVEAAAALVGARGRVVPGAVSPAELVAQLADGRLVRGEATLGAAAGRVDRVALAGTPAASPAAVEAILEADLVVLGPGSLYSSVIAALLPAGLPEALRATAAVRVLAVNLREEPGETAGLDAADHVEAVLRHLGPDALDAALVHRAPADARDAATGREAARGAPAAPVPVDRGRIAALGVVPISADLASAADPAHHDPGRLARALLSLARRGREGAAP